MISLDHAYHGHVMSLIDISPYKFNKPGIISYYEAISVPLTVTFFIILLRHRSVVGYPVMVGYSDLFRVLLIPDLRQIWSDIPTTSA